MNAIDESIVTFLNEQTAFTLATVEKEQPYCATCYYAFEKERGLLIFKSSGESRHIKEALENNRIGGTVLRDKTVIGEIQGVQFTGRLWDIRFFKGAKAVFLKKYPFSVAISGEIFMIELITIKFTNNRLGFGKKIHWNKEVVLPN